MFYRILGGKREALLPSFAELKDRFYLAGGTALALQIGHRDSIDFDFFSPESFDTGRLFSTLRTLFAGHTVLKTQDEKDTLSVILDEGVRVSFFAYPYPLVATMIDEPYLRLASKEDIGCMKLSAITGRATQKDYVDVFFILKEYPLEALLALARRKFPQLDTSLILKSLVYFEDVAEEPVAFTEGHAVSFADIQKTLKRIVKDLLSKAPRVA